MFRTFIFILGALIPVARAELPASKSLFGDVCAIELGFEDTARQSTDELAHAITDALDRRILSAEDLGRHYVAGTRGRKLKMFISYITKQLADDVTVRTIGRGLSPLEADFIDRLQRIRKNALAFGARSPADHARLTKAWQTTVRNLARTALGLDPNGRGSLYDALEKSKRPE